MQRIDIHLGADAAPDGPISHLLAALADAGVAARLVPPSAGESGEPAAALVWQARDDPLERARLLALGAGDVAGPWMHPAEALARALRLARAGPPPSPATRLQLGELEIDLIEREARRDGRTLGLLQREFELLHLLARRAGRPQSRETLLRDVWRLRFDPGTNVVEVHVSRLRAKLDRDYAWPMLRTVRGAGYALVCPG